MPDLPIACTLTADDLLARREGLISDLLRRAEGHEDLGEGLRFRFAPTEDTLSTIAQAVDAERRCCRFLRFAITVEPDGGPMFLELSGPTGTREFLAALLEVPDRIQPDQAYLGRARMRAVSGSGRADGGG
jgi:hypothetical protein